METLQIDILDPKAKKMLEDMVAKDLIGITDIKFYNLTESEKTLINIGMNDLKEGRVTSDSIVREEENVWLKE